MKKLLALLISVVMVLGCASTVFAENKATVSDPQKLLGGNYIRWTISVSSPDLIDEFSAKVVNGHYQALVAETSDIDLFWGKSAVLKDADGNYVFDFVVKLSDPKFADYVVLEATATTGIEYGVIKYDAAYGGYYVIIESNW